MSELIEILKTFPAAWSIPGFIIAGVFGAVLFAIMNKRVLAYNREATEGWRETTKDQIKSLNDERNSYRDQLHTERNAGTAAKLRIVELESRPDISALFKASQDFYKSQTEAQGNMSRLLTEQTVLIRQTSDSILKHDEDVENRMKPVADSLKIVAEGIKELLRQNVDQRTGHSRRRKTSA